MTNMTKNLTVADRQIEAKRICDSLTGQISKDERDRLYGTIACLSRSAYNRGQFPDSTELTAPRQVLGATLADKALKVFSRSLHDFRQPFLSLTSFESDASLVSLYNSLTMLTQKSREVISQDIFGLIEGSFQAGLQEDQESDHPMTILGGISTW